MKTDVPRESIRPSGTVNTKNAQYIISLEDYMKLKPIHGSIKVV